MISSDSANERFRVTVHVEEGVQYRLGDIRVDNATVFASKELRKRIALREGDIFNIQKIREGIGALRTLYTSKGYLNFVVSPEPVVDDARRRISVIFILQEGQQFRFGRIEILGLDQKMENILNSKLKSGAPFNPKLTDDFLAENKTNLPIEASYRDIFHEFRQNGTVDLKFDFRRCS